MKAWHFSGVRLRDGSPVPKDGEVLRYNGPVAMCKSGLHASKQLIDALLYAQGSTICRVEVGGIADQTDNKVVARERTILWRVDGERLLRRFARLCALDVIDQWDAPDVVVRYLRTGDESIRDAAAEAARTAARAADEAWDAAAEEARAVAWNTTWTVVRAAAEAAARGAAKYASWMASETTSWNVGKLEVTAVRAAQNRRLTRMVYEAHRKGE